MKRVSSFLAGLIVLALSLAACAPTSGPAAAGPIAIVDGTGYELKLDAPAQKIISLAPSNTEYLFAVSAGDQVIARDDFSNYPEDAMELPTVGGFNGVYNLEEIARLQPDLILASPLNSPDVINSIKEVNPNVFVVPNPDSFDDLYTNIKNIGKLTGHDDKAQALVDEYTGRVKTVLDTVAKAEVKPKVFYELDATEPAKPWTAGPGTFIDLLIGLAGGENIGAKLEGEWAQISQEALIVENPDVILLGDATYGGVTAEQVAVRPGWDVIKAVSTNRVLPFNDDLVSRPGPRMVEGLEELAKAIHPELFE